MTQMKIIRSADGNLINIGDWDYGMQDYLEEQAPPDDWIPGTALPESCKPVKKQKITNPLPAGAYEEYADVVTGKDGGLYLANDPRVS